MITNLAIVSIVLMIGIYGYDPVRENGMIFIHDKILRTTQSQSKMKYVINLDEYFDNSKKIENFSRAIARLCSIVENDHDCDFFMQTLRQNLHYINNDNDIITSFRDNKRQKRDADARTIILTIFEWMFGGQKINDDIVHEIQNASTNDKYYNTFDERYIDHKSKFIPRIDRKYQ